MYYQELKNSLLDLMLLVSSNPIKLNARIIATLFVQKNALIHFLSERHTGNTIEYIFCSFMFCLYTMYRKKKVMVIMDKCIGKKLYMQLLYYRKFFLNRQIHLAQHTRRQHPFEEDDWIKSNS